MTSARDRAVPASTEALNSQATRRALVAGFLLMLALIVSACSLGFGGANDPTDGADSDAAEADEAVEPTATATTVPLPTPTPSIPDSGNGPIIVGAVMADSGVMVKRDQPALEGIREQVRRLNEAGGLLGREIELIEYDSESRVGEAENGATELVRLGADVVFVSCDPVRASAAIDRTVAAGIVTFVACGADETWADFDDLVFSFSSSSTYEGQVMAEWALENGFGSAVTLEDATNPDAEEFCRSFTETYRSRGGNIVFSDTFTFDSLDPFIDRLAQRPIGASAVVVCSHLPGGLNGAPTIIELVRERGIESPILAGSTLDGGPTWFNIVNNLGTLYMVTPSSTHGDDPNPAVRAMVEQIDGDALVPPSRGWTVFGADAVEAWSIAVQRGGSVDGVDIAAQLERFANEPLISSQVTFGPEQHMDPERDLRIIKVEAGSAEVVDVRPAR